jgi:uncharacterized protein involved in tolerance to divalent cations
MSSFGQFEVLVNSDKFGYEKGEKKASRCEVYALTYASYYLWHTRICTQRRVMKWVKTVSLDVSTFNFVSLYEPEALIE